MNKTENLPLYYLKAIILSVVLAHSPYTALPNETVVLLLERLSRMGVFAFFLLAGYFFHPRPDFWQTKLTRLLIPWLTASLFMYTYPIVFHSGDWSIKGFINYTLGNGSYLYWLSMLLFCYLLTYHHVKSFWHTTTCVVVVGITFISTIFTAVEILPQEVYPTRWFFTYLNPYLNIFNWIGIFALGIWLQGRNRLPNMVDWAKNHLILLTGVTILSLYFGLKFDVSAAYWSYFALPCEGLLTLLALGTCTYLSHVLPKNTLLFSIGKRTRPLSLYHIILINHILTHFSFCRQSFVCALLRPVLCIGIMYSLFKVVDWTLGKYTSNLQNLYRKLLGW